MSPRSPERRLTDIREAIIGEAAAHLPEDIATRHPEIPWRGLKGMRLWLDHEYHRVDSDVVWRTVDERLPALAEAIDRERSRSRH